MHLETDRHTLSGLLSFHVLSHSARIELVLVKAGMADRGVARAENVQPPSSTSREVSFSWADRSGSRLKSIAVLTPKTNWIRSGV